MDKTFRLLLDVLIGTAILFVITLIVYLFSCGCFQSGSVPGQVESRPSAPEREAQPRVSGDVPAAVQPRGDASSNDSRGRPTPAQPLHDAQAPPQRSGGPVPPFQPPADETQHNNDRARKVPTGPSRGTEGPSGRGRGQTP
jgi:hypothetical protein